MNLSKEQIKKISSYFSAEEILNYINNHFSEYKIYEKNNLAQTNKKRDNKRKCST